MYGRRDTSTNLRYKFGDNLKTDERQAIIARHPEEYRLPAESRTKNYVFAREYFYFVYPTNFRDYEKAYEGSFQHGGVFVEFLRVFRARAFGPAIASGDWTGQAIWWIGPIFGAVLAAQLWGRFLLKDE